jgi:hypothetical protein
VDRCRYQRLGERLALVLVVAQRRRGQELAPITPTNAKDNAILCQEIVAAAFAPAARKIQALGPQ